MPRQLPKLVLFIFLLCLIVVAAILAFTTDEGHRLMHHPHEFGTDVRTLASHHWLLAPILFVLAYVVAAILMLPVWWLLLLAGAGFGLPFGILWSDLGATLGATLSLLLSRWIAADYFHQHIETKLARLRTIDERLGHNGLLVVMTVRILHFLPFGLSNYLFGLTTITRPDVAIGTLLGNLPAICLYVGLGAGFVLDWRFLTGLVILHIVLGIPILLRYLKPHWFQRLGVE